MKNNRNEIIKECFITALRKRLPTSLVILVLIVINILGRQNPSPGVEKKSIGFVAGASIFVVILFIFIEFINELRKKGLILKKE
ncbi:hypothetical protein [Floccifex sp.]|uniref:hypothetical protein n=1 Tax=Floccifex sp. TaxID=2815810 RepID=UPI002A754647|nr:hypothetical protein [Floccifex sp.]MDD7281253.1 hypothetical protein [Erysipelotrichaceae bacterium]MDY2958738.1 hypothetical protein [Floccifex sp.]